MDRTEFLEITEIRMDEVTSAKKAAKIANDVSRRLSAVFDGNLRVGVRRGREYEFGKWTAFGQETHLPAGLDRINGILVTISVNFD